MTILPVLGAFAVIGGCLAFLVWCGARFDEEAAGVEKRGMEEL
jgi:hypothetical protein